MTITFAMEGDSAHSQVSMEGFSTHLFWDTESSRVDLGVHQTWFVRRVLEKGLWSDWKLMLKLLGRERIRVAVTEMRHLEGRALNFACAVLNLEKSELRCSILKPRCDRSESGDAVPAKVHRSATPRSPLLTGPGRLVAPEFGPPASSLAFVFLDHALHPLLPPRRC